MNVDKERLGDVDYINQLKQQLPNFDLIGLNSKSELVGDRSCLFVGTEIINNRLVINYIDINNINKAKYMTVLLGSSLNYKLYNL